MLQIIIDEQLATEDTREDDIDHSYCPDCHPEGDVSYCGMSIVELEEIEVRDHFTPEDCALCVYAWGEHECD